MTIKELTAWVEANPGKSILIGGGLVIFLLWIFGAFSKGQAADSGQSSLAAAYYAAEAQQAVVGGQIQMANISSAASTAQALISAKAATDINAQNTTTAATINAQQGVVVSHLADQQLQATLSNNATLLSGTQIVTSAQLKALEDQITGTEALGYINNIIPQEIAMTGGFGNFYLPGGQQLSVNTGTPAGNPNAYQSMGFTPAQANAIALHDAGLTTPPIPAFTGNDVFRIPQIGG